MKIYKQKVHESYGGNEEVLIWFSEFMLPFSETSFLQDFRVVIWTEISK
jgi:hypothetical protein